MRTAILTAGVFLLTVTAMFAQAPDPHRLTFDVASIRPFTPPDASKGVFFRGRSGGPGTPDPGRINWPGATLNMVLMEAYNVKHYQINGPEWLDMERYDIVAKVPEGATKEQVRVMWQNLLADRFGVVFHRIQKQFTVEELTVAKGGPKLKETTVDPNAALPAEPPPIPPGPPKLDANGFPDLPGPGLIVFVSPGPNGTPVGHMVARGRSMQDLADFLGDALNMDKPVVDKTGLTGKYDFNLEYTPDLSRVPRPPGGFGAPREAGAPTDSAAEPGSNLTAALQSLRLKLNSGKATLDVLVIDKAEKASEN